MRMQRKAVIATALAAAAVAFAFAFAMKDRILEQWYLHRFKENGEASVRASAATRLGDIGAEDSLLALQEYMTSTTHEMFFRRGLPGRLGGVEDPQLKVRPSTTSELEVFQESSDASRRIRDRIGLARSRAACYRYLKQAGGELRTKVWFAQLAILAVAPVERLPEMLRNPGAHNRFDPGSPTYDQALDAKPWAIAACIQGLSSDDRYARGGAAFALSLCGAEAHDAVPALERAVHDPDPFVSESAAEALERIRDGK